MSARCPATRAATWTFQSHRRPAAAPRSRSPCAPRVGTSRSAGPPRLRLGRPAPPRPRTTIKRYPPSSTRQGGRTGTHRIYRTCPSVVALFLAEAPGPSVGAPSPTLTSPARGDPKALDLRSAHFMPECSDVEPPKRRPRQVAQHAEDQPGDEYRADRLRA